MHHRVLQRQLKKLGVSLEQPPDTEAVWAQFLDRVDRFYQESDQGRYLLERSLAISSREMQALYDDLQQASESRIASERNKLRAVISSLGAGLCTLDKAGLVVSINPEGERLLGFTEADMRGRPFLAWATSSGDGQVLDELPSLEEMLALGQPHYEEESVFMRKDGTHLPVSYTLNPIREEDTLRGAVLVFFDITGRKQAEEALRESEERHRTLLNHLPVGVYRSTPEGRFIEANSAMAALFGVASVEALQALNARHFFLHSEDRERYVEHLLRDGTITAEFPIQRPGGEVIWVRDYARAIRAEADASVYFDGIIVNITERKQAQEVAQRRTKLLDLAQKIAQLGSWEWDFTTGTIQWSDELYEIFGLSPGSEVDWENIRRNAIHPDDREQLKQRLEVARATPGAEAAPVEYRIVRPDGTERSLWGNNVVFFDENERPVRMVCAIQDITERKQAEEALRESEERHRTLLEAIPDLMFRLRRDGTFLDFKGDAEELILPPEEIIGSNLADLPKPPGLVEALRRCLKRAVETGEMQFHEYEITLPKGVQAFEARIARSGDDEVLCIIRNITERRRAEKALRASEDRFRTLAENIPGVIYLCRNDERYSMLYLNDAVEVLTGYPKEDFLEDRISFVDLFHPTDAPLISERVDHALARREPFNLIYRLRQRSGAWRWVEERGAGVFEGDELLYLEGFLHDITERKRAEEDLRESEQRFRDLFESSPDAIFVEDLHGNVIDANPAACRLHRTDSETLIGRNVRALVPPDQRHEAMLAFAQMVAGELDQIEGFSWTTEGEEVPVEIRASHITQDHQPALLLQVRDITVRRQAEQRLRLLEASVSASLDGITISAAHQPDFPLVYVSPGFERMTGYTAAEVLGFNCRFLQHDDTDQEALEEVRVALRTETQCRVVLRNYRKDGALFWNELTLYPLYDNGGRLTHYVGIQRDITERKQAAQELARINAKLEQRNRELQDFAHVASHDLQEPLRKIRAFADLMQEEYHEHVDGTGQYYLNRMQDAASRMSGLITDLLAYSRVTTQVRPFDKVNLNAVVTDVLSDLEMQIEETGGRITVSNLPTLDADSTQMHQLFQNFIGNALKFHKPGVGPVVEVMGTLEKVPAQAGALPQTLCRLEIRDNGIGFDEKYLDRIFTPFQRLHGRGAYAGTGMGLAICRRIVERHHGVISAHSVLGEGATFVVTLPVHQDPVPTENDKS